MAIFVAACGIRIGSLDMRFGVIDESLDSGIGVASTMTVRNAGEWARLWQDHEARIVPARPLPFVDFGREIVVAVFLGRQPDRCRRVRVERVVLIDDTRIIVRYREVLSATGAACAQSPSCPAAIVRIPFTDLPVRFEPLGTVFLDP